MINKVISRANRNIKISTAALLLASSYFASGLLGLIRDRLLAAHFGIGGTLDAYFAAFSVPDLLFTLLVTGALAVTFIPVLTDRLVNHNRQSAWELSSSVVNFLALATFIGSILIFVFASPLMWLVAPKFDPTRHHIAVELTRILAINPFLFSISSVAAAMQQAFGRFFFYALAPVIYNIGIIIGVLGLSHHFGIYGVAIGAVIGAGLQMVVQQFGLAGLGFTYQFKIYWQHGGFKQVLRLMVPRSIDEGVAQLSAVIERAIASGLAIGSIAAYQYAFNLKNLPITLVGSTIATAAFPQIAERAAGKRTDAVKRQLVNTMQIVLWFVVPAAGFAVIMRGYIVRILFGFAGPTTASVLGWFGFAIVFQATMPLVARVFYAYQDTKTPLYTSLGALVINVITAIIFSHLFGIRGLAMAESVVAVLEVSALLLILRHRLGRLTHPGTFSNIARIVFAAFLATSAAYLLVRFVLPLISGETGFFTLAPKFAAIVFVTIFIYILAGWWVRLKESELVVDRLLKFMYKPIKLNK